MTAYLPKRGRFARARKGLPCDLKPPFPLSEVTVLRALLLNRDGQDLAFSLKSARPRP